MKTSHMKQAASTPLPPRDTRQAVELYDMALRLLALSGLYRDTAVVMASTWLTEAAEEEEDQVDRRALYELADILVAQIVEEPDL